MFYPKFYKIWYKNLICNLKLDVTAAINVQVWASRTFNVSVRTIQNRQREQEQTKISNNLFLFLVINFLVRGFILFEFQIMTLS